MKKQFKMVIAAIAILLAAGTVANAQCKGAQFGTAQHNFKKSDKLVEGTVSYSKTTGEDAVYSFNPTVGYFVTNRVAVGAFGQFGKDGEAKTTNFGAFARCYFLTIGKNLHTFSQVDIAANSTNTAGVKTNSTSANLGLGVNYFVSSKLALTMNVANLISYEGADGASTTTIGFTGIDNPFSTAKFGVLYKF